MKQQGIIAKCVVLMVSLAACVWAAPERPGLRYFPDTDAYKTLVCDFHVHTVFSDGVVWPTVRVEEAWREGLDAIALTDHIEYQPHKEDLPTHHARPYAIAAGKAKEMNILLIKGSEITKDTPPGHYNAIFINDIDPIDNKDVLDSVRVANEQEGFVFWNHHTWKGEDKGKWEQVQTTMFDKQWLHGMEVANGDTYYPQAHRWCLEKGLVMLGNSDIHQPSYDAVYTPDKHRTLTLVLAKERTVEAVEEAVRAGRTIVWWGNTLVGKQEYLLPLFEKSVTVRPVYMTTDDAFYFEIVNNAFVNLELKRTGKVGPAKLTLGARTTKLVKAARGKDDASVKLSYTVTNLLVEPEKGLPVSFEVGK